MKTGKWNCINYTEISHFSIRGRIIIGKIASFLISNKPGVTHPSGGTIDFSKDTVSKIFRLKVNLFFVFR